MPTVTHDPDGNVWACPECDDTAHIFRRINPQEYDHEYRCHSCGHEFDDIVEREARSAQTSNVYGDDGLPNGMPPHIKDIVREARGD
jgi:predicted RNA-binding Zn-ribbon protein involved in translation (DUF1610 family)